MYNQIEAVLSQYELKIKSVEKGRGTYICETDKGMKLLVPFRGSKEKGAFLKCYLEAVKNQGFFVEQIEINKNMEAVTEDEVTGERFVIKDFLAGTELNTGRQEEIKEATLLLGRYHEVAAGVSMDVPEFFCKNMSDIVEIKRRHCREITKVKNYIRGRKKKNEFEQIFMRNYEDMLASGKESLAILEQQNQEISFCLFCHGDYNQHNVVWAENQWRMVNFENFCYGWPMLDLSNFLRKMMEKHDWDEGLGMEMILQYQKAYTLSEEEHRLLYGLLLFPEKFWKVVNHYMSSRKSWISEKDIDKLKKVIEQEQKRRSFLEKLFL